MNSRVSSFGVLFVAVVLTLGVGGAEPVASISLVSSASAQEQSGSTYLDQIVNRAKELLAPGPNRDPAAAAEMLSEAAKVGSAEAMLELSALYVKGDGVTASFDQALALIEQAIAAGEERRGTWHLAELYAKAEPPNRDMAEAVEAYQKVADMGDAWAMIELGRILATGDGVNLDFARGSGLLRKAIGVEGDSRSFAYETMGDVLRNAPEGSRDAVAALANYRSAADLGSTSAMFKMAAMLKAGEGVPVDYDGAREALLRAVEGGAGERGWFELGELYANGPEGFADLANAADAYGRSVDLDNPWAMIALAEMLGYGNGVPADLPKAERLLQQAIALEGDSEAGAYVLLGELYRGPGKDPQKALEAYRAAVDLGSGQAMLRLAAMLRAGEGTPADFGAAQALLRQAIDAGEDRWGWAAMGALAADLDNPDRNLKEAAVAYGKAAELGDPWSMITLGSMLSSDDGLEPDYARAIALLMQAAALGGESAKDAYSTLGNVYREAPAPYRDPVKAATALAEATDLGDAPSMLTLADMHRKGDGIPVDDEAAEKYLKLAVSTGAALQGWSELGSLYADPNSTVFSKPKAADANKAASDLGDAWSSIALARMLGVGDGVPVDFAGAVTLLDSVAKDGGDAAGSAYLALGNLYLAAADGDRSPARAAEAYARAAELGETESMFRLAAMLSSGDGVPADFDRARALLEQAVAAGAEERGWAALGTLYASANAPDRNIDKAVDSYGRAADLGDPWSAISLAQILGMGDEVPPQFDRATQLLEQAATAEGDAKVAALTTLGDLYRAGYEDGRNGEKAADAYRRAIAAGSTGAMFTLASMYQKGDLVGQDIDAARALYEDAIAAGEARRGWLALGDLYAFAPPEFRNAPEAAHAYAMAADLDDPYAMVALAKLTSDGDGVDKDLPKAVSLLETAIAAGGDVAGPAYLALADIYQGNPDIATEAGLALQNYIHAADAGEGRGHLMAAEIIAGTTPFGARESEAAARHFTEAARLIDVDTVTKAMFGLQAEALYTTVQRMLADRGYAVGMIDGVLGPQTVSTIKKFCADQSVSSCSGRVVGYDFLAALLSARPAG